MSRLHAYREPLTYTSLAWLLLSLPLALLAFTIVVAWLMIGAALAITWAGIPILVTGLIATRASVALEQTLRASLTGLADPVKEHEPHHAPGVLWGRLRGLLLDVRTRRELAYVLLRPALALLDLTIALIVIGPLVAAVTVALGGDADLGPWRLDHPREALLLLPAIIAWLVFAPAAVRTWTANSNRLAAAILQPARPPRTRQASHRTHHPPPDTERPMTRRRLTSLAVAATLLALATPALAPAAGQAPRVKGSLCGLECSFLCIGHDPTADAIHGSHVWCAWNGDHVQVHITLRNSSDDDISATIRPSYRIRGHGRHGSSLLSLKKVEIDGDSLRDWFAEAGEPDGVQPGTPISKCEPSLTGATRTPGDVAVNITLGTRRSE